MKTLSSLLRLRRDERGLALVEFAISLPVLLTLTLFGLETWNYALCNLRVSQMGMMTADNAARVRDSISEADVNELFIGAKLIGDKMEFAQRGRIILSSLEQNAAKTGQYIRWQRCSGAKNVASNYGAQGKGQNDSTLQAMGPVGNQIAAMSGTAVMFVEVVYDYKPLVGKMYLADKTLRYTGAFNVRQRTDQVIKNGGLASSAWSTCDKFSA